MMRKQGITLTTVIVVVIVLLILAGAITASTHSTINYTRLSSWVNEIMYIQDVVNEYSSTASAVPYTSQKVKIDTSNLSIQQINEQFLNETITDGSVELNVLDLGILKITNTTYGNLETTTDVYAYSTTTGKVYYVKGLEIDGKIHYTYTEELRDRFNLIAANNTLSSIVFVPSTVGYTNEPVSVKVKVPSNLTVTITTSNAQIAVGTQTLVDGVYEYNINNNKIAGNYDITVSYAKGTQNYTTTFNVNSYDNTPPAIKDIANEDFVLINGAVYLTNISATDTSGIKQIKYTPGVISKEDAKTYFVTNGSNVVNGKINLNSDLAEYTIYAEDRAGNFAIITFTKPDYIVVPSKWADNVTAVVDGVPIPKGFVASPYNGENKKNTGLVIYELNDDKTAIPSTETHQTSLTTRNQYVWVPVDKGSFDTTFIRKDYQNSSNSLVSNTSGQYYGLGTSGKTWEVVPSTVASAANLNYMSTTTLAEVQAMYASVREYGGFYIARYEAGLNIGNQKTSNDGAIVTPIYSMMNKAPYNYVRWSASGSFNQDTGGAVGIARSVYIASNTKYGVISTPTYSVQWDRTMAWWLETGAKDLAGNTIDILNSTNYGNYADNEILLSTINSGAQYSTNNGVNYSAMNVNKNAGTTILMTTGATEEAKVNNIYDMAGNLWEWTMEGFNANVIVDRGGSYDYYGPACGRNTNTAAEGLNWLGFRCSLYIKK